MPSWRGTCAATPASPSEVSAARRPSLCRLLPDPCPTQGLCGSVQAACRLPEGAQPPAGLCSKAGNPSGDPPGALCTASAQAAQTHVCPCAPLSHAGACLHAHSMRAGLHTSSAHSCRLAPSLCTAVHTHTDSVPQDLYLLIAQDERAAGRGWGSQGCAPGSPLS